MENLYTIKSVEISSRSIKGDKTSNTPNHWANSEFTFENLNVVVQKTLDLIIERYGKDFFQKLVVKNDLFASRNKPSTLHRVWA